MAATIVLMTTLDDLEARVAALEAAQADYRAVLAAVNALGANQRADASAFSELRTDVAEVETELRGFRRSNEESLAELKDLIVGLRDT